MDDMPFGLARQTTYAKLSPEELESMGKQAAIAYLSKAEQSLNDAVIKVAKEHPSISTHQVQRVIEFANQETFSRLFADNEKYASDKNIEFPVADPGVILHELNDGAKPQMLQPVPDEYSCDPVKTAASASAVEADLALTKLFLGVDLASPHSEKTAAQIIQRNEDGTFRVISDRILAAGETKEASTPADRILSSAADDTPVTDDQTPGEGSQETYDEAAQHEKVAMGGPESVMMNAQPQQENPELVHRENMRAMERRVELEKKKQELIALQAKGMEAQGDQGGAPAPSGQPQMGAPMEQAPPPVQGAPAPEAPPAAPMMPQKMAAAVDLTKQAMAYAKAGRPKAAQVLDDLRQATSLDNIKVAARAKSSHYQSSEPHNDLIRAKQKVARLLEDARSAKDKNEYLHKEAVAGFQKAVLKHVWDGGNIGEVTHLLGHVNSDETLLKVAMGAAVQELKRHGYSPVKLQAQSIQYEMEKGASARAANPQHPIADSYATMCKLAEGQRILDESYKTLRSKYEEIEGVLTEAMTQNAAAV